MDLTPAKPEELTAVAALVNSAYRGEGSRAGWTTETDYIGGQRTDAETLRADLAGNPNARLLVLRDAPGGPLLGCVWLEPAEPGVWYLGMLTVRPDLQDRQLGRSLLAEAECVAAMLGAQRIQMTVVSVRDTLIAWYERRGYALTGERRPFPYDEPLFGEPKLPDLEFVVLEKALAISGRDRFVAAPDVHWRDVPGELLLFDARADHYYVLNEPAAEIWRRLAAGASVDAVAQALCQLLTADLAVIGPDVSEAAQDFVARGLMAPAPGD
jgi:ribosomal protein S18 acetylase RimI-like enzyme